jgi:hypothetical protein
MNKTKTKTLALVGNKTLYMLLVVTFGALLCYLFFIGQTVFKLVAEKNISSEIKNISAEIGELELRSLSLNDTISIERAYELGFVDAKTTQYVAKTGELSLR